MTWRHARGHLFVVLLNLTALGAALWGVRAPRATAVRIVAAPTASPSPTPTAVWLHVYVSGAVATPDVVVLAEGARADDAVSAAGGFTGAADPAAVNLAAPLADGQQLHVPAVGEAPPVAAGVSGGSTPLGANGGAGGGADAGGSSEPQVNINTATAAELEDLPGVGPALAARIIAHRTENGPFTHVDGLLDVSGIGAKTLARFADRVALR